MTETGSSTDVTANVSRSRECTAVVLLGFENDDVDFRQK